MSLGKQTDDDSAEGPDRDHASADSDHSCRI